MAPVAKYTRISNHEPAEDEQRLLELSPSTAVRDGRPERYSIQRAPSPWNAECITRLLFLFIVSMIAIGFVIHNLPAHMGHDHHHDCNEEEEHHTVYHKAAVASGQQECSDVGAKALKDGGNAVDAAIAAVLCQGVVEPYFSGIGGGLIMTIYNHTTKKSTCINAREKAPYRATPEMFIGTNGTVKGGKSVGVPGELRGIEYAYYKYGGGLDWRQLFEPAISKARNGFKVSGSMEAKLIEYKDKILEDDVFCAVYCNEERTGVKKEGDIVKNLLLADTLTEVQESGGVDVFYDGKMTGDMVDEIKDDEGIITVKDFQDYRVEETPAIEIELPNAEYTIHAPPLPFGGAVFGAILSIMDLFDVGSSDFDQNKTLQWHRTDEAFRHAYGLRYSMGDPDLYPEAQSAVNNVTSGHFAKSAKKKIFDDKTFHDPSYYGATFLDPGFSSTSHLSVLAPNKDAVSVTSTINYHFGSLIMSKSTGVVFNNEMDDFSFPIGQVPHDDHLSKGNQIEGGKRPLSSMSPVIFVDKDKEPTFIIGAAGGIHIPTSVANVMLRLLYFGTDDFDEPIRAKRIHDSLLPDVLGFEDGFDTEVLDNLRKLGHNVKVMTPNSHVNGIKNHGNHIHAFSDLRNKGAGTSGW